MTLNEYIDLLSGSMREKTRFVDFCSAVLQQVIDLSAVVSQINAAYSIEYAQGAVLDGIAASFGLSRADTTGGLTVDDATFRSYVRMKMALWQWDGTDGTVPDILSIALQGSSQTDNQNGFVSVSAGVSLPAASKKLFPIPAGVGIS